MVAASLALVLSLALLVVPLVGSIGQILALRGDTPARPGPPEDQLTGGFTWVRTVDITPSPSHGIWARVPVGGLSGIDCDASGCLAISDDPGRRGPVRAYPLDPETGRVGDPVVLTDTDGVPYRPGVVDPESIRLLHTEPAGLVWSAEGTPTITVADRGGRARYTLSAMREGQGDLRDQGIRANQGLEGLAVIEGAGDVRVVTATEAPPRGEKNSRITVYEGGVEVASYRWPGTGISEILYDSGDGAGGGDSAGRADSAGHAGGGDSAGRAGSADSTGHAGGGDSAGGAGQGGSLLVLERGYTPGVGNSAVLWRTELTGPSGRMLTREPVVDLAAMLGADRVGNVESLAWWTRPDGTRDLLVGTDDNFQTSQRSVIHILSPETRGLSPET